METAATVFAPRPNVNRVYQRLNDRNAGRPEGFRDVNTMEALRSGIALGPSRLGRLSFPDRLGARAVSGGA